jgi:protein-L-isoaspartate O-methyltransferase
MYGCIVEALDISPNTSVSFLNIGSGTGYVSCIVSQIVGPTGTCFGVEIHEDVLQHCQEAMGRWKQHIHPQEHPYMKFVHGNGLQIDSSQGEPAVGFDRIYVGASVERSNLNRLASLLRPGGILVGPGMCGEHMDNLMQHLFHAISSLSYFTRSRGRTGQGDAYSKLADKLRQPRPSATQKYAWSSTFLV